jgi:hypothetical protein
MPGILRRILRRISLESACSNIPKKPEFRQIRARESGAHQCGEVVPSIAIARLERTELQHLEITMKTYRVSDFEQGVIISSPPPQELVLDATTDPCAENVGNRQSPQDGPPEIAQSIRNVGKRKTPADLLELIPSE